MSDEPYGRGTAPSLLICDDNEGIRALLAEIVGRSLGIQVVGECADGNEVVLMAEQLQPDVILLDLAMPGADGFEALPKLQQVAPDARIIVFSGFAGPAVAERLLALGATSCLQKGAPADTIMATIYEALSMPWVAEPDHAHKMS